jgi:hypothetical protein
MIYNSFIMNGQEISFCKNNSNRKGHKLMLI